MTLQHLRSSTANKRPDPTAMADGQIALNTAAASPGLFYKDSAGNLVKAGPVHVGSTAPNVSPASGGTAGNSTGEAWLDTSGSNPLLKIWSGAAWQTVQPVASGTVVSTADTGSVTSTMIANGTIVDADVNASAAIAGTKVSPNFGGQTITTTGVVSAAAGAAATPSITFTGDLNTGIYSPGADQVAISTGGSGRLFVDANGRVGVGTTSPGSYAHNGNSLVVESATNNAGITISASSGSSESQLHFADGTAGSSAYIGRVVYSHVNDSMQFTTAGSERARIDSSGRVGIGTSTATEKLTVNGSIAVGSSGNIGIAFHNASPTATALRWLLANNSGSSDTLTLYRYDSSGNYAGAPVVVDNSGRVGIGTTSPDDTLHLVGSTGYGLKNTDGTHTVVLRKVSGGGILKTASNHALVFGTNDTERARLDSSGRLLVGTSSARSNFYNSSVTTRVQIVGTGAGGSASQASLSLVNESANADEDSSLFILGRSFGGNTLVTNNARLGVISFQGADGSELIEGASVAAFVDGTSGANDLPTRLVFSTTADGASSPTERMRITSDAYVRLASGTGGIQFNGDTAAANALDDYEEGTWTPSLNDVLFDSNSTITYTSRTGTYTKIGRMVTVQFNITINTITPGNGQGFGPTLPFAANADLPFVGTLVTSGVNWPTASASLSISYPRTANNGVVFTASRSNDTLQNITSSNFAAGDFIAGSISYFIA